MWQYGDIRQNGVTKCDTAKLQDILIWKICLAFFLQDVDYHASFQLKGAVNFLWISWLLIFYLDFYRNFYLNFIDLKWISRIQRSQIPNNCCDSISSVLASLLSFPSLDIAMSDNVQERTTSRYLQLLNLLKIS